MTSEYYNIHDIIKFTINKPKHCGLFTDINPEYEYFRVDHVENPDITIDIGKFTLDNKDCYIVDNKYYIKYNYFYCKDEDSKARWNVEIKGFEDDKIEININGRSKGFGKLFFPQILKNVFLRPFITYLLIKKGYLMLHGGAVKKDDHGFLFLGRSGVYKTSIIIDLIKKYGYEFLGEENIIVNKDEVLPYPFNIKSFNYKLNNFGYEEAKNKIEKFKLGKHVLFSKEANNDYKFSKAKISNIYIINMLNYMSELKIEKKEFSHCIKKAINNELMELSICPTHSLSGISNNNILNYIRAYSYIFPENNITKTYEEMKNMINELFKNKNLNIITLSKPYTYEKITKKIYENINK